MRRYRGHRPASIIGFAIAILALALSNFALGLSDLHTAQGWLNDFLPRVPWNRDLTIVAIFSQFTIALIPLIWIYFFRARFARWFVLVFGSLKFFASLWQLLAALWFDHHVFIYLIEPPLIILALALLFSPSAKGWLTAETGADAENFA